MEYLYQLIFESNNQGKTYFSIIPNDIKYNIATFFDPLNNDEMGRLMNILDFKETVFKQTYIYKFYYHQYIISSILSSYDINEDFNYRKEIVSVYMQLQTLKNSYTTNKELFLYLISNNYDQCLKYWLNTCKPILKDSWIRKAYKLFKINSITNQLISEYVGSAEKMNTIFNYVKPVPIPGVRGFKGKRGPGGATLTYHCFDYAP